MQHILEEAQLSGAVEVDSAGTAAYHSGEKADPRSRATARARGVSITSIARQFLASDFESFDYVLAMDQENFENLQALCPDAESRSKLSLLRSFDPESPPGASVPDPYYGGEDGFTEVFDICYAACQGLLSHLRREHDIT